jgi:pimeloyl-ACP methyl ester carboxylesterase
MTCLLLVASAGVSASAGGPREPLTFRNVGLYGVWNEYFVSADSPFDFLIIQAYAYEDRVDWHGKKENDKATWNDWLKRARANGKRVIAVVCPAVVDDSGKLQTLASQYDEKSPLPLGRFEHAIDRFFEQVDEKELYAITLAEENVFWNGQSERLEQMYDHVKKAHDIPVFQWYTPSHTSSVPGLNYPNLKADGWMADEYFLRLPLMEKAMRGYTVLQKPVFQLMWALPQIHAVPSAETTFWDQFETCRKYDIPVAFYFWVAPGDGPIRSDNTWDPTATPVMRKIFEDFCIHSTSLAKRLPPVPAGEWDLVSFSPKRIELKLDDADPARAHFNETLRRPRESWGKEEAEAARAALYFEAFRKPREMSIWNDASICGFANLKWDSSPLQFCPRNSGTAESVVQYEFRSPADFQTVRARASGNTFSGMVKLEILDKSGKIIGNASMQNGLAEVVADLVASDDRDFSVRLTMSGRAPRPGTVLASIDDIFVECLLAPLSPTSQPTARGSLRKAAGKTLDYLVIKPNPEPVLDKRWMVVYLYGAGGSLDDYNLAQVQYETIRSRLSREGAYIVVPDLGKSHFLNQQANDSLTTLIQELLVEFKIDGRRVHLVGTSMGGGSALAYAVNHPDTVRSVCAIMPMTDFANWIAETPQYAPRVIDAYGGSPSEKGSLYDANSSIKHADVLATIPVMLLHGTDDTIVLPSHSRKLAAMLKENGGKCTFVEVGNLGHSDDIVTPHQDEIVDFLIDSNR